jgi:uncharacterized protein YbjT (DUF2867 family)
MYCGDKRVGWIALQDVAAVAATVLLKGPEKYGGKNYWMSTESLNGSEVAAILSEVLNQEISCFLKQPEDLWALLTSGESKVEPNYAEGAVKFMRQVMDGRMGYIGSVRDDVPLVTGRTSTTLRQWAIQNRERLRNAAMC